MSFQRAIHEPWVLVDLSHAATTMMDAAATGHASGRKRAQERASRVFTVPGRRHICSSGATGCTTNDSDDPRNYRHCGQRSERPSLLFADVTGSTDSARSWGEKLDPESLRLVM